jgi:hypothetical protein
VTVWGKTVTMRALEVDGAAWRVGVPKCGRRVVVVAAHRIASHRIAVERGTRGES